MSAAPLGPHALAALLRRLGAQFLVRDWLSANHIVFADPQSGRAVIDTGYASHAPQTLALVEHALQGRELERILNTHLHSDHCGGNAPLVHRWPGATIEVPAGYREALEPWDEQRLSYRLTGQSCTPFRPSGYLEPGRIVELAQRSWECHAAPGHDPMALLFFQPDEKLLISGDALWADRLAIVFPALVSDDGFDGVYEALDAIERLAPVAVLPGHGDAFGNVDAALRAARRRLDAFAAAPDRHRRHSARVLVMFRLLEVRIADESELLDWMVSTPIFAQTLCGSGREQPPRGQAAEVVDSLVVDGQLERIDAKIRLPRR